MRNIVLIIVLLQGHTSSNSYGFYWLSMKLSFGYDWSNMCPHAPYTGISKKLQGWADDLLKDLMRSPFLIHMPESQTPQVFGETLKIPDSHFTQSHDGILLFRASS